MTNYSSRRCTYIHPYTGESPSSPFSGPVSILTLSLSRPFSHSHHRQVPEVDPGPVQGRAEVPALEQEQWRVFARLLRLPERERPARERIACQAVWRHHTHARTHGVRARVNSRARGHPFTQESKDKHNALGVRIACTPRSSVQYGRTYVLILNRTCTTSEQPESPSNNLFGFSYNTSYELTYMVPYVASI